MNFFRGSLVFILCCTAFATGAAGRAQKTPVDQLLDSATRLMAHNDQHGSLRLLSLAREESRRRNYRDGMGRACYQAGNIFLAAGNLDSAQKMYTLALQYTDTTGNGRYNFGNILNNLAITFQLQDNYTWSLAYFQKSVAYTQEDIHATIYSNIGSIFNEMKEYDKALHYFNQGWILASRFDNKQQQVDILCNIASAYAMKKELKKADSSFHQALELATHYQFEDIKQLICNNIGAYYLDLHQPDKAIHYLQEAQKSHEVIVPQFANLVEINFGKAYIQKRNYDSALYYLKQALQSAESLRTPRHLMHVHDFLATAYAGSGDFTNAYNHQKQSKLLADTLYDHERTEATQRVEAGYQTAQKDRELLEKQWIISDQRNQLRIRNVTTGIISLALLALGSVFFLLYRNSRHKQALKVERLQHLIREQELERVKAIMHGEEQERSRLARELHDGIMVHLSASKMHLKALMHRHDQAAGINPVTLEPILEELDVVSDDLRKTAHNLMPDLLLAEGLAEAVYYFCNTIQRGLTLRIQYEQMSDIPRFDAAFELSVYRIIQELIQNVIKHARATEVYIQMHFDNGILGVAIEDDGKGIQPEAPREPAQGMGLKSIQTRLDAIHGKMEINSNTNGTSINLEFEKDPLNPAAQEQSRPSR